MIRLLILLLSAAFLNCSCTKEGDPKAKGSVRGNVYNKYGQPVEGAVIQMSNALHIFRTIKTDFIGGFFLDDMEVGEYQVSVQKDGYIASSQDVAIIKNTISKLDFTLSSGQTIFLRTIGRQIHHFIFSE